MYSCSFTYTRSSHSAYASEHSAVSMLVSPSLSASLYACQYCTGVRSCASSARKSFLVSSKSMLIILPSSFQSNVTRVKSAAFLTRASIVSGARAM